MVRHCTSHDTSRVPVTGDAIQLAHSSTLRVIRPTESFVKTFISSFFGSVAYPANCEVTDAQTRMCCYSRERWFMFFIGLSL